MSAIARTTKQIGAVLRRVRRQKGLTQRELGDLTHARQATVSKLESGKAGTQLGILINALAALDLELVIRTRSKASTDEIDQLF